MERGEKVPHSLFSLFEFSYFIRLVAFGFLTIILSLNSYESYDRDQFFDNFPSLYE